MQEEIDGEFGNIWFDDLRNPHEWPATTGEQDLGITGIPYKLRFRCSVCDGTIKPESDYWLRKATSPQEQYFGHDCDSFEVVSWCQLENVNEHLQSNNDRRTDDKAEPARAVEENKRIPGRRKRTVRKGSATTPRKTD